MCCDVMCAMSCYLYITVTQTSVLSGVHAVNYQFKEHLNYTLPAGSLPDCSTVGPPGRENHLTSGRGSVYWPHNQRGIPVRCLYICPSMETVSIATFSPVSSWPSVLSRLFNQTCPYVNSDSF